MWHSRGFVVFLCVLSPSPDIPENGSAAERPTDQPTAPHDLCLGQPVHVAYFSLGGKSPSLLLWRGLAFQEARLDTAEGAAGLTRG